MSRRRRPHSCLVLNVLRPPSWILNLGTIVFGGVGYTLMAMAMTARSRVVQVASETAALPPQLGIGSGRFSKNADIGERYPASR